MGGGYYDLIDDDDGGLLTTTTPRRAASTSRFLLAAAGVGVVAIVDNYLAAVLVYMSTLAGCLLAIIATAVAAQKRPLPPPLVAKRPLPPLAGCM